MQISDSIIRLAGQAETALAPHFARIDHIAFANTAKVLDAFREHRVAANNFDSTSGYGYDDKGREVLDRIWADVMGAEAALVRQQIVSGTHALTVGLFGLLRPGDVMLSVAGKPYDTLEEVIGITGTPGDGSLRDFGVGYDTVELTPEGSFDWAGIEAKMRQYAGHLKMVFVQRSKGYLNRRTLSVEEIGGLVAFVRAHSPDSFVVVDNCYGEFVETIEPTDVGADLVVGSLIKNPGGGLAPIGGYICGRKEYVDNAAYRLTAPGLGRELGASLGVNSQFFQGLFMAPTVTAAALKGAIFAANLYERLGFKVIPDSNEPRYDIIQAVELMKPEYLIAFCKGIQAASPVDSHVTPEPWDMPGYDSKVIMAAGTFVSGASIELSADGPLRPPYSVFFQGGLTWGHAKLGIMMSLQKLTESDFDF